MAPPLPSSLAYPDFVYPVVPAEVWTEAIAERIDHGWRYLQNDNLQAARDEFVSIEVRGVYPALAGEGYVSLARANYVAAAETFAASLAVAPRYVPALVGQGQAMLGLGQSEAALAAFMDAVAVDPSLFDLGRRVDLLRIQVLQQVLDDGRRNLAAGRLDQARLAYLRAIENSPDTAFLYRELGDIERQRGDLEAALNYVQRAAELDGRDVLTAMSLGRVLEALGDYEMAVEAYQRAASLSPTTELGVEIELSIRRSRNAMLPDEFHAMATAERISRGDLAALVGIRLGWLLETADPLQVVVTDIRAHWTEQWIVEIVRAGVIDEFPNHTFQPDRMLRRVDLASVVRRVVVLLSRTRPSLRASVDARTTISDVDPGHLNYLDVSTAVSSGVMMLVDGRFDVNRAVSGPEAIEVVALLQDLANRN
jgi:tetratricopeptide (TPR) repeat protein